MKSQGNEKIKQNIGPVNTSIFHTQEAVESMVAAVDGYVWGTEWIECLYFKVDCYKGGAEEKQLALHGLLEKKKMLLKKKEEF